MNDDEEQVILVDEADREVGLAPKLRAHRDGELHRAVSVFVFDRFGRILLQRRSAGKYHSAGRWANACCTHPRPGESLAEAAHRRLREEMGIVCALERVGAFTYRAVVGAGLVEHEIDHVFVGHFDSDPSPDADEVESWRWVTSGDVGRELSAWPDSYAAWFAPAFELLRAAGKSQ